MSQSRYFSAAGVPNLVKRDWVKEDVIVIDVGINKVGDNIIGDVNFDDLKGKVKAITPVPGGVGPMTIACLLKNTLECFKARLIRLLNFQIFTISKSYNYCSYRNY